MINFFRITQSEILTNFRVFFLCRIFNLPMSGFGITKRSDGTEK
jgi:hypothetical protein